MYWKGKNCNNCGLQNQFSRLCRKPKQTRSKVNSIEDNTTDQSVNAIQNANYNPQCESDFDSSDDNMLTRIASNTVQIEPKNMILPIGNTKVGTLIESGNVCKILNESLATEVINHFTFAQWLTTATAHELKTFANETIPVIGMVQATIESNGWRIEDAEFTVVRDALKPSIG